MLPFTTEEAWLVRCPDARSVHLRQFPETPASWRDDAAAEKMAKLREVRSAVTQALEEARAAKRIGSSLEAAPVVHVFDEELRALVQSVDFAELCITSGIDVRGGPEVAFGDGKAPVIVTVEKAPGVKCARSWKYFDPATADPRYPDITPRDAEAVAAWDAARGVCTN